MLRRSIVWARLIAIPLLCVSVSSITGQTKPHAKIIPLDNTGKQEAPLLTGPPETVTMRSGLVALEPGKSVGKHSTGKHEELLVVLEGQGRMTFADGSALPVEAGHAVYCPPATEHNVTNTGSGLLRYVYVVASVPDEALTAP